MRKQHYDREKNTQYKREQRARKRAERQAMTPLPPARVAVEVPREWTPQEPEPMPLVSTAERVARFRARFRELVTE